MWLFPNCNHVRMVGWPVHAMVVDGSCQVWWWVGGVTLQFMSEKHMVILCQKLFVESKKISSITVTTEPRANKPLTRLNQELNSVLSRLARNIPDVH